MGEEEKIMKKFYFFTKQWFLPFLVFFAISLTLSIIWFRKGLLYGGAEVGLLTYDPARWFEIQKFLWWEAVAPGWPIPHFLNATPFYFVLSMVKWLGFSPVVLQGFVFCVLLFLMGFGVYLFTLLILGQQRRNYALLAGLFYMFNPYTMVDVWHRFVYTGFFLAAFLPFLAFFWKKWISEGSLLYLCLFFLTNLSAVYMYGNLSSIITVWLLLTLLTIPLILFPWKGIQNSTKIGKRFLFGFILWILINIWWLLPILTTGTGLLSQPNSADDNLTSLINISRKTILPYTLQLTNPFYLFFTKELGDAYKNFPVTVIPWIGTVIIFLGIITSLSNISTAYIAIAYLIVVVIAKGVAIPFSAPLLFAFTHFYFLGVIRNPYEKLGILLPFFGSLLFVIGLEKIINSTKRVRAFIIIILLVFFGYSLPMFTGHIFGNKQHPLEVDVPNYYKQANEWLLGQRKEEGNILQLSFSGRDVVTYDWGSGYHGVEINELLFSSHPSISRETNLKNVDNFLKSLTLIFSQPFSSNKEQILTILENLNVRFIVLHKDAKWLDVDTYGINTKLNDPNKIADTLDNLPFLEKVASFGKLDIYKLIDTKFKDRIFISNNVQLIIPGDTPALTSLPYAQNSGETVTPVNESIPDTKFKQILIFPQNLVSYQQASASAIANMVYSNLKDPTGADSILNKLEFSRNYFEQSGELESKRRTEQIILSTKTLFNIYQQKLTNKDADISLLMNTYKELINDNFKNDFKTLGIVKLFRSFLNSLFQIHLFILSQQIYSQSENQLVSQMIKTLKAKLIENDFLPQYESVFENDREINRRFFKIAIPTGNEYELMMDNQVKDPTLISNIDLRINGVTRNFGKLNLDKGNFEISTNELLLPNHILPFEQWQHQDNIFSSPFFEATGGGKLKISFEASLENVSNFALVLVTDTEYADEGNQMCLFHRCYPLQFNSKIAGWQNFNFETEELNPAIEKIRLKFIIPGEYSISASPPRLSVRYVRVQKILDNTIFLRKKPEDINDSWISGKIIESKRQSPVLYTGKFTLEKPSFIFFSQTFHPGWSLKVKINNAWVSVDKHYIGNYFANAWFVEKPGEYEFRIEFEPQKAVSFGYIISTAAALGLIVITILKRRGNKHV